MPGLVPPARPKPLRRGEGRGIHAVPQVRLDVDGRDKPGHDELVAGVLRPVSSEKFAADSGVSSLT
jgi:hypothetical protein